MPSMRTKFWPAALRCVLSLALLIGVPPVPGYAAGPAVPALPAPGTMVTASEDYHPAVLKGLTFDPARPFRFDFHIDTGDSGLRDQALQTEADKLIRYFMAALTVPERQLWVNLSPYEKNRIIPPVFGETAMGRDLLAQDYLLKQLTASLIYPESELGGRFWKRVYERAQERFGTVDIPVDTYNKIWIVPETAELFVRDRQVFVTESRLKVLLEEDYVAQRHHAGRTDHGVGEAAPDTLSPTAGMSAQIVREIVIPEIEREVNYGKNFANLRQIFHSLILAAWYKQNLNQSVFGRSYVDQGKTDGIDVDDPVVNQRIYEQYVTAYKKGVYNYIREDYDAATASTIPRKYFSGGVEADVTRVLDVRRSGERFIRSIRGDLVTAAAYARASHDLAHAQGSFETVLADIAAEIGLAAGPQGFAFVDAVRTRGGRMDLTGGGYLELTEDGILKIIDPRFTGDHAGRGTYQMAVYARDEVKARHELAELRHLLSAARELGILTDKDGARQLGLTLQAWANDYRVTDDERLVRQNQLIKVAHAAHRAGLVAEGQTGEAGTLRGPALLRRPVDGFDITIASDGARALRLYHFMRFLGQEGYHPLAFSAAQVAAAVIQNNPELLIRPQDMTAELMTDTFSKLSKYDFAKLESTILAAPGLSFEQLNLFRQLGVMLRMVGDQAEEADLEGELNTLRELYPEHFENVLSGVQRLQLRKRLNLLNRVQRRYHAGELPEVLSFGDKHGRTEDLERILDRARAAAAGGKRLTIVGHGDGFDRGTDNVRVLRIMQELKQLEAEHKNLTVKLLLGNHDAWMIKSRMAVLRRDEDVWFMNGGTQTLEDFSRQPDGVNELIQFALENFDVYYIDDWGMLHIHGGFDVSATGVPSRSAEELQDLQARLEEYRARATWDGESEFPDAERVPVRKLMDDIDRVLSISRENWDLRFRDIRVDMDALAKEMMFGMVQDQILRIPGNDTPTDEELRSFFEENWKALLISNQDLFLMMGLSFEIDESGRDNFLQNRLDGFMARMGVLGVVNGHHHHMELMNADQRIFGVDVDDDDAGHMTMGPQGVTFYPVHREGAEEIVSAAQMQRHWQEQKDRLTGHYAERDLIALLQSGKLKPPTDEDAAVLADWQWERAQMKAVNPVFDQWVSSGEIDAEDMRLLRDILSGDARVLDQLLETRPDKVAVKQEDRSEDGRNGRMVYLTLSRPLMTEAGEITILRMKGVRPRYQNASGELESHKGGGFDHSPVEVNTYGRVYVKSLGIDMETLDFKPSVRTPQGAQLLVKAKQEYQLMQRGQSGGGFVTDYPLAYGQWADATHAGRPVGFVIAGMRSEDVRLGIDTLVDPATLISSVLTDEPVSTRAEEALEIYYRLGASLRRYHDAGYFHRYIHHGNVGVEKERGEIRVVLRDLDTTVRRDKIKGKNPDKIETTYRLLDLQRIVGDLSFSGYADREFHRDEITRRVTPFVENLVRGYFPEIDPESGEFTDLVRHMADSEFASYVRSLHVADDVPPVDQAGATATLWHRLRDTVAEAVPADNAILVQAGEAEITSLDRDAYVTATRALVHMMAERNMTTLLFTGNSAFITMELVREEWTRRFGDERAVPDMHVVDNYGGSSRMLSWQSGHLLRALQQTLPDFDYAAFKAELEGGRIALLDEHILSATKMKTYHRLFIDAFGHAPVIGALTAARNRYKHIGMGGPSPYGEFDVITGALNQPLAEKISAYASALRDQWKAQPPYRGDGRTDPLVEIIKDGIHGRDNAVLVDGASHYDYATGELDRLADAALNLVEKTAGAGITRVFFTGTSSFISRELFVTAWEARFGATIALPELMVLPSKKLYTLWRAGDLPKELKRLYPRLDQQQLVAEMQAGKVALMDDHIGSGAKMKSFHRIFKTDLGAAPVMGALLTQHERLEHYGFNAAFGSFDVMFGAVEYDLVDKLGAYSRTHREQWLDALPYAGSEVGAAVVKDALVESVKRRLRGQDQALLNETPGGIDLNPQGMTMNVTGDAAAVIQTETTHIPVPDAAGYVPVIIHISPTTNLPLLLGEDAGDEGERLSKGPQKSLPDRYLSLDTGNRL